MANSVTLRGEPVRLAARQIKVSTCKRFLCYKDGSLLRFYYKDASGKLCGAKTKTTNKTFAWEGSNPDNTLYGQWLWSNSKSTSSEYKNACIITEGELDCLSVAEVFPKWAVVSIPNGAPAAKKAIQNQLEWLQGFDEVILFFDNDEEGRKATEDAASILPGGKVKIAKLDPTYKDASDALVAGDSKAISNAIWKAEAWVPGGIVAGRDLLDLVATPNPPSDHSYPWKGLNDKLHGIRFGELTVITAGTGAGKSTFCRELATSILDTGERVGYLALEESNRRTALGLMSVASDKPLHIGEYTSDELKEIYATTLDKWNLFLFDGWGSYDPQIIYNRIEYLALGLDVRVIFLDHLSILLSGLDGDERRTIDITMTRLRSLVQKTGVALFLVCHVSGDDGGTPYEEGGRVKINKLRGSRSIGQLSDSIIALERNQQDDSTGTTIRVLKNRYSGEVGPCGTLTYDLDTARFKEADPFDPVQLFPVSKKQEANEDF